METVKKFECFRSNWSTMCNDSKTGSTNSLACLTTNIRYKPRYHERKRVKINERTVPRRLNEAAEKYNRPLSKALLTENNRMNHLKSTRDHETMDYNPVIFSDETTIRVSCVKGLVWNSPGEKSSCELSSIQSKSMFGVASQVKASVASSVLNKI